jgi:NAD(P)-dependent dehydrogenase (short-subunit alcohol dehydrogenase family)
MNAEKVILACRSVAKGEAAVKDIEQSTKRKGVLEVWQLDLSIYENVKQFAERAKSLKRLDSAVLNAGISTTHYKLVEGNESTGECFKQQVVKPR